MGKPNFQSITISRVISTAPELQYVGMYHADENCVKACMTGYAHRSLVYILTVNYDGTEVYLYAGKSRSQYARLLNHLKNYHFHHIYLFECSSDQLTKAEAKVIRGLRPLLNQNHNPDAKHNKQFLGIQYEGRQTEEQILRYLENRDNYAPSGLYGFALPPAVFAVLMQKASEDGVNCSELLQRILEQNYMPEIYEALQNSNTVPQTNLITAKEYGTIHGRSREQVKTYLIQGNRVYGTAKIGRDWVVLKDASFPEDQRRKLPKNPPARN